MVNDQPSELIASMGLLLSFLYPFPTNKKLKKV